MRTWIDVAVLAKSKNKDGRLVAKSAMGLPFLLVEGDEVALVPPQLDLPRNVVVRSVKLLDDYSAELKFEEVTSPDIAAGLVGMHCLIRSDEIDPEAFEEPSVLWEGYEVVDEFAGPVGTVCGIVDNTAQMLIEVDHEGKRVLIPFVDEIVTEIEPESGTVTVRLPDGLLDL